MGEPYQCIHGIRLIDTCTACNRDIISAKQPLPLTAEGVKFDQDKIATDLLPFDALEGTARVLAYGKKKYAARNWEKGMAWGRLFGAALRHAFRWAMGEEIDPESGLPHLDHFTCCALMLSALVKRKVGTDDRIKLP